MKRFTDIQIHVCVWTVLVVFVSTVAGDCPNGFVRHDESCYKLFLIATTWPEALIFCEAFGAELAEITTAVEQHFIESYLHPLTSSMNVQDVWIGGTDLLVEGSFYWSKSADPLEYSNWVPGEPNDLGVEEDCMGLLVGKQYGWNDAPCETKQMFLCEIPGYAFTGGIPVGRK